MKDRKKSKNNKSECKGKYGKENERKKGERKNKKILKKKRTPEEPVKSLLPKSTKSMLNLSLLNLEKSPIYENLQGLKTKP